MTMLRLLMSSLRKKIVDMFSGKSNSVLLDAKHTPRMEIVDIPIRAGQRWCVEGVEMEMSERKTSFSLLSGVSAPRNGAEQSLHPTELERLQELLSVCTLAGITTPCRTSGKSK